jgi:hypothetical protein
MYCVVASVNFESWIMADGGADVAASQYFPLSSPETFLGAQVANVKFVIVYAVWTALDAGSKSDTLAKYHAANAKLMVSGKILHFLFLAPDRNFSPAQIIAL